MYYGLLARCPFCGARVDMGSYLDEKNNPVSYAVDCDECGASVSFDAIPSAEDPKAALAAWNRRAEATDDMACPFCGGEVKFTLYPPDTDEAPECGVECSQCGAYTNFWGAIDPEAVDVEAETVRRWSRRSKAL